MAVNSYDLGDLVRCSGAFTDANSAAVDPDTVKFAFRTPSGSITIYTYVTDAQLVKDSTGNYHVDVDANEVGSWWTRFYSTGNGQASAELEFKVRSSRF